jgi:hypothetical protein
MNWVPISRTKHFNKALSRDRNYLFAKTITLVPLCLEELSSAVTHMPLVFYQNGDSMEIGAVLGLNEGQNLFVREDDSWPIKFVPAALRCHPFTAIDLENGETTIVYEEHSDLIVDRSDGDPIFNMDGSEGEVFKSLVALAVAFKRDKERARKACSLLAEFELFEPFEPRIKQEDGSLIKLKNTFGIDRTKFKELEGYKFIQLQEVRAIEVVYAHLFSLNCFSVLIEIMNIRNKFASNLEGLGLEIFANNEKEIDFNF